MEPFRNLGFEYSLPQKVKAEIIFSPGAEALMVQFMEVAREVFGSMSDVVKIEDVDKELILGSVVAGNLFGLFDQEERLRTASFVFLGMILNSFLVSEGITFGVRISELQEDDVTHIYSQLAKLAYAFVERSGDEVRRQVEQIYSPLKGLELGADFEGDEADEDPSLS